MIETELDAIKACLAEDKLFQRAVDDAVLAMMRPLVGLSIPQAIVRLDQLRQAFEGTAHDQHRPTIRIPGWGPRRT